MIYQIIIYGFCYLLFQGLGLGAYDDYKKIKFKNSSGISFKFKIISQILIAIVGILV